MHDIIIFKDFILTRIFIVQKVALHFLQKPVNYELRLAVLNFLRIFSLNCS